MAQVLWFNSLFLYDEPPDIDAGRSRKKHPTTESSFRIKNEQGTIGFYRMKRGQVEEITKNEDGKYEEDVLKTLRKEMHKCRKPNHLSFKKQQRPEASLPAGGVVEVPAAGEPEKA